MGGTAVQLRAVFTPAQVEFESEAHTKINPQQSVLHAVGLMDLIVSLRKKKDLIGQRPIKEMCNFSPPFYGRRFMFVGGPSQTAACLTACK